MGDRNNSYQDFLNDLHQKDGDADDCRYGVYDYDYQFNPDGAEATFKSKIFLMSWCPDSSKIKKKMLYSSSFDTLKRGESFISVTDVCQFIWTTKFAWLSVGLFSFCGCSQGGAG